MRFRFNFMIAIVASLLTSVLAQTKVACVGNSITFGYGLNWNETTYPSHLQEMLGDSYQVKNFGNSGKMFHKKSKESYWEQTTFKEAYDFAPDIVVIELGTNDSKYFYSGDETSYNFYYLCYGNYSRDTLIQEMLKDYEALLDTFAHQTQKPKIYATLQPYAQNLEWVITDSAIVNVINPIIQEVANTKGITLIDLHEKFSDRTWLQSDSVHPNAEGAKELAKIIASAIQNEPQTPLAIKAKKRNTGKTSENKKSSIYDLNGNLVKEIRHHGKYFIKTK